MDETQEKRNFESIRLGEGKSSNIAEFFSNNDESDKENSEILEENQQIEKERDEEIEDEYDEEDVFDKEEESKEDEELEDLKTQIKTLNENFGNQDRFPRVESKPEFASGMLNSDSIKRAGNLDENEIYDLLEKRKFYNFLNFIGWEAIAEKRVSPMIKDIEDYSLSKKGKLIDSVFIDRAKQESLNYEKDMKGGRKGILRR